MSILLSDVSGGAIRRHSNSAWISELGPRSSAVIVAHRAVSSKCPHSASKHIYYAQFVRQIVDDKDLNMSGAQEGGKDERCKGSREAKAQKYVRAQKHTFKPLAVAATPYGLLKRALVPTASTLEHVVAVPASVVVVKEEGDQPVRLVTFKFKWGGQVEVW